MSQNIKLWNQLAIEACPVLNERMAELLYFRVATAWGADQQLRIPDGIGGWVDLTKLYEQYKLLTILKGD